MARILKVANSSKGMSKTFLHVFLVASSIAMVFPFIWMLLNSFKSIQQLLTRPTDFWPDPWIFTNFEESWNALPFGGAYFNSIYIVILSVIGTLLTSSMAAYGLTRFDIKAGKILLVVFLATQMIPKQVTLIPFYLLMSRIGWIDSHLALIVPAITASPFAIFLMRQFMINLPIELEEAARIDGAGRIRTFFQVVLPNIRPGLGALAIITALDSWNSFLLPLVLLNRTENFTVPVLLAAFRGQYGNIDYGLLMAASAISVIPMLIAFIIGQKQIVASLASAGLGGR
jgi:multiple sugar transport system permease protein